MAPPPRPAMQKSLSRRVSFNEATLAKTPPTPEPSELESQISIAVPRRNQRKCNNLCNSFCVCASMGLCIILLLALLTGGIYFAFLQSNLPEVRIERLDVRNFTVVDSSQDTFLTGEFELKLNLTNVNDKIELAYKPMIARFWSEGIELGRANLPELRQKPKTSDDVVVRTAVNRAPVEEAAAKDLRDNLAGDSMLVNLELKGFIDFYSDSNKMNGFPFKITCSAIEQSDIDRGYAPRCSAKMSIIY